MEPPSVQLGVRAGADTQIVTTVPIHVVVPAFAAGSGKIRYIVVAVPALSEHPADEEILVGRALRVHPREEVTGLPLHVAPGLETVNGEMIRVVCQDRPGSSLNVLRDRPRDAEQ